VDDLGVSLSDLNYLNASLGISKAIIIAALLHCCLALPPECVGWLGRTEVSNFFIIQHIVEFIISAKALTY